MTSHRLLILPLLALALPAHAGDTAAKPAPSVTPIVTPSPPPTDGFPIRKLNGLLVDEKGRALYTWDNDKTPGRSDCNNQCRLLWPPITASADAVPRGVFTLVTRDDGQKQWAFRGKPLYRWVSDKQYGDAGGDGVSGAWHLVRVAPAPAAKP